MRRYILHYSPGGTMVEAIEVSNTGISVKKRYLSISKKKHDHLHTYLPNIKYIHSPKNNSVAIIPAYNEELSIGSLVLRTKQYVDDVIVIDDGSNDNTTKIADLAGAITLRLPKNMGKAIAIMYGFKVAQKHGYKTTIMLDGDGQHNPDEIPRIIEPVVSGKADLVIGSRYLDKRVNIPINRKIGHIILNYLINFTTKNSGYHTTDSQSGFRALSNIALQNLDFHSEGYSIESDMITHFTSRNLNVREVPIEVKYDVPHKHKKNSVVHGFEVLNDIIGFIGYKRPLLFFGFSGLLLTITGSITGFFAFSQYTKVGIFFALGITSFIMLSLGLLLIASGFILNSFLIIITSNFRREDLKVSDIKKPYSTD